MKDEENAWNVDVTIEGVPVTFKIDTGADVTAIPDLVYANTTWPKLKPPDVNLRTASSSRLQVLGQFDALLRYGDYNSTQPIYVVEGLRKSLLGRPAIDALNILKRIHLISTDLDVKRDFPKLFTGLGLFPGEYRIRLKEGADPVALSSPRRVPIPLMPAVKAELERMEANDVIFKVDEPTDWCSGMVVRPKPNKRVRICVDLKPLNESVKRERLMLPSVEPTLAQLHGAKLFSKLDANSGFWQVKLAHESALLTTFITPYGRYAFNRLPFGITSAPEYF